MSIENEEFQVRKEKYKSIIKELKKQYSVMSPKELFREYLTHCLHIYQCGGTNYGIDFNPKFRHTILDYIINDCDRSKKYEYLDFFKNNISVEDFVDFFIEDVCVVKGENHKQ